MAGARSQQMRQLDQIVKQQAQMNPQIMQDPAAMAMAVSTAARRVNLGQTDEKWAVSLYSKAVEQKLQTEQRGKIGELAKGVKGPVGELARADVPVTTQQYITGATPKQLAQPRQYAPELVAWRRKSEKNPIYVDMNKPEDVQKAVDAGYTETPKRDSYREDAVLTRIVDKFNADPAIRKVEQMDTFANLIIDVSNSENPVGHASLETLMARASGEVGNLSEADKKPFGGSRALESKMAQYFSELYSGKKTTENLGFIRQLADTFRKVGQRKKTKLARERAEQYSRSNRRLGFTPDEIYDVLDPFGFEESQDVAGESDIRDLSTEELEAIIRGE